jgi:hypothetical protein
LKASLLLLAFVPLASFAQFNRGYTGPTMQQNQQSRQHFDRVTNQYSQDFYQRQLQRTRPGQSGLSLRDAHAQAHAKQQKLEQEATESLARLAQEQQRQRQEHPAQNPQQAAAQQKADEKQLTLLAVKNYRDVFLQGQLLSAMESMQFSPSAQQSFDNMSTNLLDDKWWGKQEGAQAAAKITAYGDSLVSLTTGLIGLNFATPPATPTSGSVKSFTEKLTQDAFDQRAANQLMQEAALAERRQASKELAKAVAEFATLSAAAGTNPEFQGDSKKLRKEVQKRMRAVNTEMMRYDARLSSAKIDQVEKALRKSTSAYLAKNSK